MNDLGNFLNNDKYARLSGIELIECRSGYAKVGAILKEEHLNGAGVAHGGFIYTLADFAFAAAVNSHGKVTLSINGSISYFAKSSSGYLTAEAIEISRSSKLSNCDVNVFDETGKLLANFKGTAYITKDEIDFKQNL